MLYLLYAHISPLYPIHASGNPNIQYATTYLANMFPSPRLLIFTLSQKPPQASIKLFREG